MNYKFSPSFIIVTILLVIFIPGIVVAEPGPLKITNLSNVTYFTYQQLTQMPNTTEYADLYCYSNLVTSGEWTGVQLCYLMNQAGVSSDVNSIQFTASDSYSVTIPIKLAQSPQTIIAYQKNDSPLSEGLRLVLPGYNGAAWISQIVSLSTSNDFIAAPAPVSVDGSMARSLLDEFNGQVAPLTPTYTAPTSTPNPEPIIDNPTYSPTIPTNNTQVQQTPMQQTTSQKSINLSQTPIAATVAIIILGFAIVFLAYTHRTKLKNSSTK